MRQNYLVSIDIKDRLVVIPTTAMLREKWIGAILDPTGRAYAGALRLDFSPACLLERAIHAVADTLAQHPLLTAHFDIEGDALIGRAPIEPLLGEILRKHLYANNMGVTDEKFLAYCGKTGLRLASTTDDAGLHVWIGFCTYTCDGASIDLIIDEIAHRYRGKTLGVSRSWADYAKAEMDKPSKHLVNSQDKLDVYPVPGPYGLDAIRNTPYRSIGNTQSIAFHFSVSRHTALTYAKTCRVTLFVLLFTTFQRAISAVSGVKTVVTGVPFVNRQHPDHYTVVGPLSNTIPVTTHHIPGEPLGTSLNQLQRAVIKAAERQNLEPAALYPEGTSPRTVDYDLPFPQLFNAWNSRREGTPISIGDTQWMALHLLPNDTSRAGFEITLHEHTEHISGRIDMNADAYGGHAEKVIEYMRRDLESISI